MSPTTNGYASNSFHLSRTIAATLTSVKTVTDPGTTTVLVNAPGKRDDTEAHGQLAERDSVDFAAIAQLGGLNLAMASVSAACSCFSSSYTAPTVTATATGKTTVTVATAKATALVTTTVKAVTV